MSPSSLLLASMAWETLQLARPLALVGLVPVALLTAVLWRSRDQQPTFATSEGRKLEGLRPTWRIRLRSAPEVLTLLALTLLVIALARPQTLQPELREIEGIDLLIALDLSGSMYAVDMRPEEILLHQRTHGEEPPNRIQIARQVLREFVEQRERDRIGLVVFAREAYVQFPLTLDYATVLEMIDQLEIGIIDPGATAIGNAIGLSLRRLMGSSAETRAILLITDGKQHGGNIDPRDAARLAGEEGVLVYSILIGEDGPTMMPTAHPRPGRAMVYRPEVHPIDPDLLDDISRITGGAWYAATRQEDLRRELQAILDALERTRMEDIARTSFRDHFRPLLDAALLFLVLGVLLRLVVLRRYP